MARSYYTSDMIMHCPGRNPVSGVYRGMDSFQQFADKQLQLCNGRLVKVVEVDDILEGKKDRVVAFIREIFERDSKGVLDFWRTAVYRVRDDKICEIWVYDDDPYALDEFFTD